MECAQILTKKKYLIIFKINKMEIKNRRCIIEDLNKFDIMAKKDDFIEVCEWTNGEGFDISITDKKIISLTRGELDAIDFLTKTLDYNVDNKSK